MIRLITVTLAGLYIAMLVAGERVEAEAKSDVGPLLSERFDFSLASFVTPPSERRAPPGSVSDKEAVKLAIAAGEALRAQRENPEELAPLIAAVETAPTEAEAEAERALWSVTGTVVNLREGPSTSNPVVGQVTLGTTADVLGEDDGWYRIETSDGAATGWIFGRFLERQS